MNSRNDEDVFAQLSQIIEKLNRHAYRVKRRAFMAMIATAINLIVAIFGIGIFIFYSDQNGELLVFKIALFTIVAVFLFEALFIIYRFDQQKKSGDIYFEEASDYYEWIVKRQLANNELDLSPIILNLRVAFREYTRNSDLPLAPGKQGITNYSIINIVPIFVVGFIILTKSMVG